MKQTFFAVVFLGAATLEIAARAYYDAVVVESRGAADDDGPTLEEMIIDAFDTQKDCFLPKDPGPCRGFFRAYYYSPETNTCERFVYSGCGGNKNRFKTKEECRRKCADSSPSSTTTKPFDECVPRDETCESRGCRAAKETNTIFPVRNLGCKPCLCPKVTESAQSVCKQPSAARGHCRALLPRWSYDHTSKSCVEFQFGGCDGNGNNFSSKEACLRMCQVPPLDPGNGAPAPGPVPQGAQHYGELR